MLKNEHLHYEVIESSLRFIAGINLLFFFLLMGCANTGPPPGGPVDDSGPVILSVSPVNRSINVSPKTEILVEYDEWIDENSFINSFFISPEPSGEIKFKIGLHKAKIKFKGGLDSARTYVVNIGTGLRDMRGNNLSSSYNFAFSTGSKLDHGMVHGRVAGDKSGYIAALYLLDDNGDPILDLKDITKWEKTKKGDDIGLPTAYDFKGEYMTQTAENGEFILNFLRPGYYRLLVFSDRNKDRIYSAREDELGLYCNDFGINEDTSAFSIVNTVARDPGPPSVSAVDAKDNHYLELVLDRALEFLPDIAEVTIVDSTKGDTLEIQDLYRHPFDSTRISIYTSEQDSVEYTVYLEGGIDFWGENAIDTISFSGNPASDTLAPVIVEFTAEGDSLSGQLKLQISEPVNSNSLLDGISMNDSIFSVDSVYSYETAPGIFSLSSKYFTFGDTIFLNQSKLIDKMGNSGVDSVLTIFINPIETTVKDAKTGSLSGLISYVKGAVPMHGVPEYSDEVVLLLISEGSLIDRVTFAAPGKFSINGVPEAYYTFEGFIDENRNGRYDFGRLNPFIPAERYTIADEDTFRVRANWETSGVKIEFQK